MRSERLAGAAGALALLLAVGRGALATPLDDKILPLDQYTTEKGRVLATKHAEDLRALNAGIYHCLPWV